MTLRSDAARKPGDEVKRLLSWLRESLRSTSFLIIWLVPCSVFLFLCLFYAYGFIAVPSFCILASLLAILACQTLFLARNRGPLLLPLAISCAVGTGTGTFCGLYIFDQFAIFPKFYANSRLYTNVVPSQPSAAVADAGKLVFTSESTVDSRRSVSYVTESGYKYCAAPVRDKNNAVQIEFWAVGIGCCTERGDFFCDASGDSQAHGGVAVFDNIGIFANSRRNHYEKARLKAESAFSLQSAKDPMYIRWVREDNLDMLANEYSSKAAGVLVAASFFHLCGFLGLAAMMHKPSAFSLV